MSTLSFALLGYGLIRFFKFFGLIIGIGLIFFWWSRIKNTVALFYDKAKIRATLMFFVPGFILVALGIYFRFIWTPTWDSSDYMGSDYVAEEYVPKLADLYIANYSEKVGRIEVGSYKDSLQPREARDIVIKSKNESDTLRAWLGDSLVIDTIITSGYWVGNFSDDVSVSAEEVVYSTYASASTEDLGYVLISEPGIERFSTDSYEDVYGFASEAPASISVSSSSGSVHKWDVSVLTTEELMAKLLDALKENGDLEGEEAAEDE
jgi:hypothetical protein